MAASIYSPTRAQPTPQDHSCCDDGDCVCRGDAPSDATPNGPGPYSIASYPLGYSPSRTFGGATVYFPIDAAPPLSVIIMCPAFAAAQSSIAAWGAFLASHGFVLVTIDTGTIFDQVPARATELLDALDALKDENTRPDAPLQGKLSPTRYGLAGWSMGGGATWLATAQHPELKTAVTLAGHNATAGGAVLSIGSRVPTLMLSDAGDLTLLGGLGQSEAAYAAIPETTPKLLYVMTGAGGYLAYLTFAAYTSWGSPEAYDAAAGRYVLAWEKLFLEDDQRYKRFLLRRGPLATTWETNLQ